jgi:hypothetical protein
MIARIRGFRDRIEYVALHLDADTTSRDIWIPVRGDRGASGERTEAAALKLCVDALWHQLDPLVLHARKLARLADVRGRERGLHEERELRELSAHLHRALELASRNLERLLDEPTDADEVSIDADFTPLPAPDPDDDPPAAA